MIQLRDKIPLERLADVGPLNVPKQLSKETALRLIRCSWAQWYQVEYTTHGPRGFIEITPAGKRAIQ